MDPQGAGTADLLIGQTVGNYLVTQKLGEGGMGSVYLAEHPTIGKKVALKVLHAEFSSNPEVAERFFTEAKSVNAIGHPNIVDIVDYGVIQAGRSQQDRLVYFIMEFLAGVTLSQVIRTEAPLPPERALMIALQVADALAASHRTNIVHRDLKPDNIILIQRGRERDFVKLLDFGIAKLTGDGGSLGSHRTRTGLVLGTPAYMSPEQCEGKPNVDHRTDVYALGICLYEMLVGRVPFIGEGYGEILVQHLTQRPVEPSRYRMLSPHVEAIVMKALEKSPNMRYPTMDEFMRALADPIGYVESHGGVSGFLARVLMPSTAPLPEIRHTPTAIHQSTPSPGLLSPVPGTLQKVPTTLGAAAGQAQGGAARNKLGFIIGGALVVVAAGAGVFFVVSGKKSKADDTNAANNGSAMTMPSTGSAEAKAPEPPKPPDVAKVDPKPVTPPPPPPPPTPSANVQVTVQSTPDGAEIWIDGTKLEGKVTNTTLELPRHNKPKIVLKLRDYADFPLPDAALEQDKVVEPMAVLVKKPAAVVQTGQTGKTGTGQTGQTGKTGTGKTGKTNTGHSGHDGIGLMKPEDM